MGSSQSVQTLEEDDENDENEEDENEEEEGGEHDDDDGAVEREMNGVVVKKVLEQEPEMLPSCYASASPLSPQLSSLGTPRMGPSIKVWDPYNVLAPPPPPPPQPFARSYSSEGMGSFLMEDDGGSKSGGVMEVYLISHGECEMSLRPDLVGGRCSEAGLTTNGKRQARALAVFLNSHGVRFNAVYSSPLDRAKTTAASVCQEMSFPEQEIQSVDALTDMSLGQWEGLPQSEVYTPEALAFIGRLQPDFSPPSGESLRQVEFRMVQFFNGTMLVLPQKLKSDFLSPRPNDGGFTHQNSNIYGNSASDRDGSSYPQQHWDLLRHRQLSRKKSGKSRLQVVTTTGDHYHDDEMSPKEPKSQNPMNEINVRSSSSVPSCVGVFSHSLPIKCLLTGILGCSPVMSHKLCIEDSSVTVLQHSWKSGWQIKRLNDTAHLRLL